MRNYESDIRSVTSKKIREETSRALDEWLVSVVSNFFPELPIEQAAKEFNLNIYPDHRYELELNGCVVGKLVIQYEVTANESMHRPDGPHLRA